MDIKETSIRTITNSSIVDNSDYFRFIFKKTEKIACAVFYVMRSASHIRHDDVVVSDLEHATQRLLDVSLVSLRYSERDVFEHALEIKYALLECEAKLRIAHAAHLVGADLLDVFVHEVDSVQRSLRKYTESTVSNPLDAIDSVPMLSHTKRQTRPRQNDSAGVVKRPSEGQTLGRRERILTILKDKNEATIKDIVEVVSDCSEKTIQRELILLIKDNLIVREGERRWSKYKLV